jgi:hypothetical protein
MKSLLTIVLLAAFPFLGVHAVQSTPQDSPPSATIDLSRFQTGDLIFQTSLSGQSLAIAVATHSPCTHMGMIVHIDGKPSVQEARTNVHFVPVQDWIKSGKDQQYFLMRLKNSDKLLTRANLEILEKEARKFLQKRYDFNFTWSDDQVYCSELIWKIYKRALNIEIGAPKKLKDFDLSHPIVQKLLKQRYGNNIPYEETVISPADMFASDKLQRVP